MARAIIFIAGKETDGDHSTSAGYIATKLVGKTKADNTAKYDYQGKDVPILKSLQEFNDYLLGSEGKSVSKIFVLSHGNQVVIEGKKDGKDFQARQFALLLWSRGLKTLVNRAGTRFPIRITMLTCESGKPHPEGEHLIYAEQMASTLSELLKAGQTLIIKGMDGHSITTTDGKNHVFLTDDTSDADIKALERELKNAQGKLSKIDSKIRSKLATSDQGKKPEFKAYGSY